MFWKANFIVNPKFKRGDKVRFKMTYGEGNEHLAEIKIGIIVTVDTYGTWSQQDESSYDIFIEEEKSLYKHIRESFVEFVLEF